MKFPNDKYYTGSATLIDSKHLLTAAHNVYGKTIGGDAVEVTFMPGRNGNELPYGIAPVARWFFPPQYRALDIESPLETEEVLDDLSQYEYDYAVLRLAEPLSLPPFGLLAASDEELERHHVRITGYPGDKIGEEKGTMWTAAGKVAPAEHGLLRYKIDTYKGESGSSLAMRPDEVDGVFSVGVHVAGSEERDANFAVRLTSDRIARIIEWQQSL
jgi:V8-like Glu-specific endopeptidase